MKPIEGVPTDVAGFVDEAAPEPRLLLSFAELAQPRNFAIRGFFENGGRRCYVGSLDAFEKLRDISIVCAPAEMAARAVEHCERLRDRFAVLDVPCESSFAASYYPWLRVDGVPVPPSGHVAGVYARVEVFKAPANEALLGVEGLTPAAAQPRGNLIRALPGRGIRVWGARTGSKDSDWKYVNLRRFFIYLERSIYEGTQWVVFEPNDEALWAQVRRLVSDFLMEQFRAGAFAGRTADQAFFVKADRTTMTQDDIDSGRLIVLIGVAPIKPAEFVIVRIVLRAMAP